MNSRGTLNKNNQEWNDWKIPLYKIYTDEEDANLITKIIKRGYSWAIGPEIEEFENELKNYVGTDYCLTLNSGTSALHALYLAYGLGQDDEIIIPSFTFISTANSVRFVNSKPIFSDIEEETFGLDPNLISDKISSKTKAIVPVDIGGLSCKINEINKIAQQNNLLVIEDAAEALGSSINNKKVGSYSDSSVFSFCGNKVLTTGEGGAIVTNSKEVYEKIKLIRSHGRVDTSRYFDTPFNPNYTQIGYNWRMSTLTAALGITQLQKLDKIIKLRQKNASQISSKLSKFSEIKTPVTPANNEHIYQMYTVRLSNQNLRDSLQKFLISKKIFSKIYFEPIHMMSLYKELLSNQKIHLPVTEEVSKTVLTLPLYPNMTKEEMEYLINSLEEFFEKEKS